MRKRFEQQLTIGQLPISELRINPKKSGRLDSVLAALRAIYLDPGYNERVFSILEKHLSQGKVNTGRPGMNLWTLFVLAQVRMCLNTGYEELHDLSNNHHNIRVLMGIEKEFGFERTELSYQNIYDNVTLLDNEALAEVNSAILDFGHGKVFKKKAGTELRLKTDSFVVESNVHFPTDYNLLWDCARKCLDTVRLMLEQGNVTGGWRKLSNWRFGLKSRMRELGRACASGGKNKNERVESAAGKYLDKARALLAKLQGMVPSLPITSEEGLLAAIALEGYMALLEKHISLVDRRLLKGETIPHHEKMFSIFETYTEWVKKGKSRPSVELGKKLAVTSDQYGLVVDYLVMEHEQDRDVVAKIADRVLARSRVGSWSFDKGYWTKLNKELLMLEVPRVVMPKLGKRNQAEEEEERSSDFVKLKNKHSAVESSINELEHCGLDRCPDRGFNNFKRYIGMGVCAFNLKKIGREILRQQKLLDERAKQVA